jgi:predicted O-methyltransferase YrrM
MLYKVALLFDYIKYLLLAKTRHGTHSPFVYAFADRVLYQKYENPVFYDIELIRQKMLQSPTKVNMLDLGAVEKKTYQSTVQKIAASAAKNSKYAKLLHRICAAYSPEYCIELGTNLGISAMYQASGLQNGHLYTLEGNPKLLEIANYNFEKTGLQEKITSIEGNFDQSLPLLLSQLPRVDYAFIDGNHRKDATLHYVDLIWQKCHNHSIIILDDIRWSSEMEEAWHLLEKDSRFHVSIDLFMVGILFVRKEQEKENFILRF